MFSAALREANLITLFKWKKRRDNFRDRKDSSTSTSKQTVAEAIQKTTHWREDFSLWSIILPLAARE